ncbi:LytR/AlgR family response regulator transcription factor [Agaribacter flavus]|uniref:LytR/AlgR family response regulator transcription factor n=1 Tax=Agaribacter flavus TaxID=1902781 RepID=A0ABV7FQX8_9ALTE
MKLTHLFTAILIALLSSSANATTQRLISIQMDKTVICLGSQGQGMPTFNERECLESKADEVDPQNTLLWMKAYLHIPENMLDDTLPYGVYLSGKSSSRVFFNGQLIGTNGRPAAIAQEEAIGVIDVSFYVPPELIKSGKNILVIEMSSHNGFLSLGNPINFIGFGQYALPNNLISRNIGVSMVPMGALILGVIYFFVASFNPLHRKRYMLLLLMTSLAACQLMLELLRALYSYPYPIHDLRLILIVVLSLLFGISMLYYVIRELKIKRPVVWVLIGAIVSLILVTVTPGYDAKTAVAILLPSLFCTLISLKNTLQTRSLESAAYFALFLCLMIVVNVTLSYFHDLLFFYVITFVLMGLFAHQAFKLNKEQQEREKEKSLIEKLQFVLEQNQQKAKPSKLQINSAGKIEVVSTEQIVFGQAAGDYVELHLNNKSTILFSGSLKELESKVPETFLRVHRSYLVNMEYISSLNSSNEQQKTSGGFLRLNTDHEVPVSRRIMPTVRQFIANS